MAKTQTRVNGQATPAPAFPPVIPVKTQEQLMREDDMAKEIARLKAENERLQRGRDTGLTIRKSEKGAVSVYGLGRWPFTLYKEQWLKLLAIADQVKAFIEAHDHELSAKEDK